MDLKIPLLLLLGILLTGSPAFASAVVEQRQQMMRQQQQEALRQKQQQIIQQQQQAYQQAAMQKQKAEQLIYQRAVQERATAQQAQQAYNQAVGEKLKDVQGQRQAAVENSQQQAAEYMRSQQTAYQQQMQQLGVLMSQQPSMPTSIPNVQAPAYGNLFYEPPVEEVVDIAQIWEKMEQDSQAWGLMIDMQPKLMTVQRMIDRFREENIQVSKPASHYVQLIDTMAFQSPDMLDQPFENILKIVAIIEYDFGNGQDKDALARQIFPDEKGFQANRKRLGL